MFKKIHDSTPQNDVSCFIFPLISLGELKFEYDSVLNSLFNVIPWKKIQIIWPIRLLLKFQWIDILTWIENIEKLILDTTQKFCNQRIIFIHHPSSYEEGNLCRKNILPYENPLMWYSYAKWFIYPTCWRDRDTKFWKMFFSRVFN